jgi:hypothetical protein
VVVGLKDRLDQLGSQSQQRLVYVNDYQGQFDSYSQAADSAITAGNQILQELAKIR